MDPDDAELLSQIAEKLLASKHLGPVLDFGLTPDVSTATWQLAVDGLVETHIPLDRVAEVRSVPRSLSFL